MIIKFSKHKSANKVVPQTMDFREENPYCIEKIAVAGAGATVCPIIFRETLWDIYRGADHHLSTPDQEQTSELLDQRNHAFRYALLSDSASKMTAAGNTFENSILQEILIYEKYGIFLISVIKNEDVPKNYFLHSRRKMKERKRKQRKFTQIRFCIIQKRK